VIRAAQLLLLGAAGIAGYLLWYSITKKPLAGCGPGSPCDQVMGSSWAYWLSIPVTAPALAAYCALLASSVVLCAKNPSPGALTNAWRVIIFAGIAVLASAAWFTCIQLFVLKSICKYCTTAHLLGSAGVILLFTRAPFRKAGTPPRGQLSPGFSARQWILPVVLGLLSFGILAAGQELAPRKTNVIAIYDGAFKFDLRNVPMIGSNRAEHYIVSLFDYTCPDCQKMHHQLLEARERMQDAFSIVSLPMPLDPRCNSVVRVASPKHAQACDYAKIGLALRLAGQDAFAKYDEWYFSQPHTPPLEEARQEAAGIIGQETLEKNLADPWVEKMIQTSVSIYTHNHEVAHTGRIPQLIIGKVLNAGPVRNVDELIALIQKNLLEAGKK
jgi:uncharacterized membrane protein